jgi:hypothetical protein
VARKARLNENKLSGTYRLAELSLSKNLGTEICTALVQKCDDKRYSYHSKILNLEKFSLTISYNKGILEFGTLCEKQVPTVTTS